MLTEFSKLLNASSADLYTNLHAAIKEDLQKQIANVKKGVVNLKEDFQREIRSVVEELEQLDKSQCEQTVRLDRAI